MYSKPIRSLAEILFFNLKNGAILHIQSKLGFLMHAWFVKSLFSLVYLFTYLNFEKWNYSFISLEEFYFN